MNISSCGLIEPSRTWATNAASAGLNVSAHGRPMQLRARVSGQVGEVLVAERDPAVEVEADGDQVDVLEQLAEAALGLLEGAEARAQVGLKLLVLERQAGGAADRLEELCVVGRAPGRG